MGISTDTGADKKYPAPVETGAGLASPDKRGIHLGHSETDARMNNFSSSPG